jgi:ribonuclease HI
MDTRRPHYLLYSQANARQVPGSWKVVLKAADGQVLFEAADTEPQTQGERLELLAVVRGLEALDRPARVTLATPSRYVRRGLAYGLSEWRASNWSWEWFGRMVPIKNRDLWQRLDRALQFHEVECRYWRIDSAHERMDRPQAEQSTAFASQRVRSNSFELATAAAAPAGVERRKKQPKYANRAKPPASPRHGMCDIKYGWISTFIRTVGLLLVRIGGGPMLAPAGRLASTSRE